MSKVFLGPLNQEYVWPSIPHLDAMSITYGDVLLSPRSETNVVSRKDVDTTVYLGPFELKSPVITAPMDTISGELMIRRMNDLGAIGTLPRNIDFKSNIEMCERFSNENIACVYAIGLRDAYEEAAELKKRGAKMVLIDVAHGGQHRVAIAAAEIREKLDMFVMAGNVATYEQALFFKKYGIDYARVGVGPGGLCTTRLVAATGIPQLSAIFETVSAGIKNIIADGGIKHPGDVAKAVAAGATVVMIGSMFGGTVETPGEIVNGYKIVRGQASHDYMIDYNVPVDGSRTPEGISTKVRAKGSVLDEMLKITGGLRSAMSYTGAHTIPEFQEKARFVVVSSSSQRENLPHIHYQHCFGTGSE